MRLYGEKKEADARTAPAPADARPAFGDGADGESRPGRRRDAEHPEDWDDVLLPDDELPVGVPAAAKEADAPDVRRGDSARRNLLLMTCLGAADGTILLLAATGALASLTMAIIVGLTVISGIGAWIAAYAAFGGRRHGRRDYAVLARMAGISIAATLASAWLGVTLGQAVSFHILPKAAGIVLFLIAAEVWGLRLPRLAHVPLPLAAVALAAVLEVALWIP